MKIPWVTIVFVALGGYMIRKRSVLYGFIILVLIIMANLGKHIYDGRKQ